MNEQLPPSNPSARDVDLSDALRWQLRAMRRDQPPAADLWPGIAARLGPQQAMGVEPAAAPAPAAQADTVVVLPRRERDGRSRWMAPVALAAGVAALAIGIAAHFRAPDAGPGEAGLAAQSGAPASLVQREADGMTRQYQAALQEIAPATRQSGELQPAFDELDRNAALILDALAHDPDSRLLLEQLRRTYARRLALAQRVAYT
ncbi:MULTISPECIES: hypothetical protein [Lysobacter]|uniref:Anti-sigma factor n=1 Tax=Lysobacter firmicutimachus TaxID=1792846 RepID=A0ABU8D5R2_9GAMM|nr:hypothetical protein [Lysobacter antibioticus]